MNIIWPALVAMRGSRVKAIMAGLKILVWVGLLLAVGLSSVSAESLKVFVSILPQAYFAERIGGELVEVEVLVGPGQSPATYEPSARQLMALAEADVFFRIGVPFEGHLLKKIEAIMPDFHVVDTRQGIELRRIKGLSDSGGEAVSKEHGHGGDDPHIWLDPSLAIKISGNICQEMIRLDSNHADYYSRNLAALVRDLNEIDRRMAEILAPYKGRAFYVYHPAFGYFGDRYGLSQVAIEIEGKEPGARQLAEIIDRARRENVRVLFVQAQFARKSARAVASAIDGAVIAIDPLAYNYLENMEELAEKLAGALE